MKKLIVPKIPDLLSTLPTADSYTGLSQKQLLERVSLLHTQLSKINQYLVQLHRLSVYNYNYSDSGNISISIPETNKGFLLDSAIRFRGEWNPQTNTPTLEKTDSSKVGWSYIANASGGSAETITNVLKGDFIVYDAEGNLFNLTAWINARLSLDFENKSQSDRAYADNLVSGLASETWVNTYFIPKTSIVDNLTTDDATKVLSAKQGKVLKDLVDEIPSGIDVSIWRYE